WPAIGLEIDSTLPDLVRHATREYGSPTAGSGAAPSLVLSSVARARATRAGAISAGDPGAGPPGDGPARSTHYKTTRWRVRLGQPSDDRLSCELAIQGVFGNSLVQSLLVEPLLSVVLARRHEALVSASGIVV